MMKLLLSPILATDSSPLIMHRNFRLLVQEFLTTDLLLNLRCDNKATIAMLEEPWRTRYLSIYGESLRSKMEDRTCLLTYVSTELQLADPLTKPTSSKLLWLSTRRPDILCSFTCCTMLVAQSSGLQGPNQASATIPEHHSNFWSSLPSPSELQVMH